METLLKKSCEVVRRAGNALKDSPVLSAARVCCCRPGLTFFGNMGMMPMTGGAGALMVEEAVGEVQTIGGGDFSIKTNNGIVAANGDKLIGGTADRMGYFYLQEVKDHPKLFRASGP